MDAKIIKNEQKNYQVQQFYTGCLAEATYYIQSKKDVAIVDPLRDTEPYIKLAKEQGAQIKYIFMTHFHADFVSGHEDLARKTGAKIVFGPTAQPGFEAHIAKEEEKFSIGHIVIKLLHTPGHTMESSSYLLLNEEKPEAIFTGDTLFLGEVGRPDLAVKSKELTKEDLASYLYDSLQNKIMPLPDSVMVYPGHGPGSPCGKSIQPGTFDSLGNQKKTNYALNFASKNEFIASLTSDLPTPPAYFFHDVALNKSGGSKNIDEIYKRNNTPLSIEQFSNLVNNERHTIIDTRPHLEFLREFIPNSYNIDLSQSFALWVGKLITPDRQFVIICEQGKEQETIVRLCRIGYDNVKGYLLGGLNAYKLAQKPLKHVNLLPATQFEDIYNKSNKNSQKDHQFLDVRNPGEVSHETLTGFLNTPLWTMEDQIAQNTYKLNKNKPVYVTCQRGARAVSAISILSANGFTDISSIDGGVNAIKQTKVEITYN